MFKIFTLLKKETLQFIRNIPLLIIVLYACTLDVYTASQFSMELKDYPVAIYDMDKTQASSKLIAKIKKPYFLITDYINSEKDIKDLILSAKVGVILVIPRDFQKKINGRTGAPVQIIMDATSSNTSELASNYLYQIISSYSYDILFQKWQVSNKDIKTIPIMTANNRFEFNQNLKSEWEMCLQEFFTILTLIGILLTATAMVNEKQFGTIEQLIVTPLKPYEIMLSKIIPMVGIFIISSFISIYCIMIPVVGIPLRGSFLDFLILTVVFCFATSGLGMLVSTVSNNLSETVLFTMLILFPIMFLSGAWVPPEAMPKFLQYLMTLSPLKYYLSIGIAIFIKGNTLLFMWKDFLALIVLGSAIFFVGALRFRKMFE